jgi:uncharacterized protein with FMN-binding domain
MRLSQIFVLAAVIASLAGTQGWADTIELLTGKSLQGTVKSYRGTDVVIDIKVGARTFQQKFPRSRVHAITIGTKRIELTPKPVGNGGRRVQRSREEVLKLIDQMGRKAPDWYEATRLNYPKTLDLKWPLPAPKGWNSQKNVGQFIWERINPNQNKWNEGVRFMHHILSVSRGNKTVLGQAMRSLGGMYHNLHEDYARSAFWYRTASVEKQLSNYPNAGVNLADCYWKLGNKRMALEILSKMPRKPYTIIKLMGDMGETKAAVNLAESFARSTTNKTVPYLYAGDALRVAGQLTDAEKYYRKVLTVKKPNKPNTSHFQRDQNRAKACIAAIKFYTLDPKKVTDGSYRASSIGYEGQVEVEVKVSSGAITSVKVTKHREKQYYSSLKDTPRNILARQSVQGIEATSSATITSEAIINATAKALSTGLK